MIDSISGGVTSSCREESGGVSSAEEGDGESRRGGGEGFHALGGDAEAASESCCHRKYCWDPSGIA
jgi:hypothetical protein